jgi:hypothetical protein
MKRRKPKRSKSDLGYDEPVKAPDGIPEGVDPVEFVTRAILDVPPPRRGQATSDEPEPDGK